jgi:histidine ammonia-lyase
MAARVLEGKLQDKWRVRRTPEELGAVQNPLEQAAPVVERNWQATLTPLARSDADGKVRSIALSGLRNAKRAQRTAGWPQGSQ